MAQEDRGLVIRGLLLFAGVGVIVAAVLAMLFWRSPKPAAPSETPPEYFIPAVVTPHIGAFPAGISWYAIYQLGETLPSAPGADIRYSAATTLARRGSESVPWELIREMLDEKMQRRNNRIRRPDGRDVYDEGNVQAVMVSALRATAAWHEKQADKKQAIPGELQAVYATVDELAQNSAGEVKLQAQKTRDTFFR